MAYTADQDGLDAANVFQRGAFLQRGFDFRISFQALNSTQAFHPLCDRLTLSLQTDNGF